MIREAMARTYWSMIQSRRCPYCGQTMTTERRGCCTYAMPCGHKLWTGERPRSGRAAHHQQPASHTGRDGDLT